MPSATAATWHNLIGCLDGIWHFGRADVDLPVAVTTSSTNSLIANVESPPGVHHFLHPLFCLLNKDGNGHVSLQEMRSHLGKNDVSHASLTALVESATRSAREAFDFPQFAALYESVIHGVLEVEEGDEEVVDAFHVYDRNRDGFISASELATVLTELGLMEATSDVAGSDVAAHVAKCQAFIDRVDSDGNGLVDLHEFKAMLKSNHFPIPCAA